MMSMKNSPITKAPSKVLREARQQTGAGFHGKRGAGRSKADSRSRQTVRASLKHYN
jgi:hypothetical protein